MPVETKLVSSIVSPEANPLIVWPAATPALSPATNHVARCRTGSSRIGDAAAETGDRSAPPPEASSIVSLKLTLATMAPLKLAAGSRIKPRGPGGEIHGIGVGAATDEAPSR